MARNFRILVDMLEGKASKEEIDNYNALLEKLDKGYFDGGRANDAG